MNTGNKAVQLARETPALPAGWGAKKNTFCWQVHCKAVCTTELSFAGLDLLVQESTKWGPRAYPVDPTKVVTNQAMRTLYHNLLPLAKSLLALVDCYVFTKDDFKVLRP